MHTPSLRFAVATGVPPRGTPKYKKWLTQQKRRKREVRLEALFGFLVFPKVVWGFLKTFGKTKKTNKTKPIFKGGSETFKNFVFLVFPKVFLVGFVFR